MPRARCTSSRRLVPVLSVSLPTPTAPDCYLPGMADAVFVHYSSLFASETPREKQSTFRKEPGFARLPDQGAPPTAS